MSGTTTACPDCATQPASPCPTLMRMSLSASEPFPVAIWKYNSFLLVSISSRDQVAGRSTSVIFSMMVRRTWSNCRDDVKALPSS